MLPQAKVAEQRNIYPRYDVLSKLRFMSATQRRLPISGSSQTELPIASARQSRQSAYLHAPSATRVGVA